MIDRKRTRKFWAAFYIFIIAYAIFTLVPVAYLITTSFKNQTQVYAGMEKMFWFHPTLDSFRFIFTQQPIFKLLFNTAIVSISSTIFSLIIGTTAAYALARYKIRGRDDIAFYILSIRMFPPIVAALPIFMIFNSLGLLDTRIGLILAYTTFNLPFVVWMMIGFIKAIPVELEEAARVDGQSHLRVLKDILLPLLVPSLTAVAIFCIIFSWNEFLFSLILTKKAAKTLPVAIPEFITWTEVGWNYVAAAGTTLVTPVLIFTFLIQRYMVAGLSMGAVKD